MKKLTKRVRLEKFDPDRDMGTLETWVRKPHVVRWWGDPDTQLAEIKKRPGDDGSDAIIVVDEVPVGYVCWQRVKRKELDAAGLNDIPEGSMDIDIAIGEEDYLGKGIGSEVLVQVIRLLALDKTVPKIIMATSIQNNLAIKAYEKAGFSKIRTFDDPEYGQMWLFEWSANSSNC